MRVICLIALCVGLFAVANAQQTFSYGADISTSVTTATLQCLKTSSPAINYIIFRAGRSTGSPDPEAPQNLNNAIAAGYTSDNLGVYIFPCPRCASTGAAQVSAMMNSLISANVGSTFSTIWLDIEGGDLYWLSTSAENQAFFNSMLTQAQTYLPTYKIGIYSSNSQWSPIVGSSFSAAQFPIWYAQYNSFQNFGDFTPFSGWSVPAIHQYAGDATVCNTDMDLNVLVSGQSLLQATIQYSPPNGGQAQPTPDPNPKCTAAGGNCIDTTSNTCSGTLAHNDCSGSASVLCCIGTSSAGVDPNPKCTAAGGQCIDTTQNQCSGTLVHNDCPSGGDSVLCCVPPSPPPAGAGAKNRLKKVKPAQKVLSPTSIVKPGKFHPINHSGKPAGESCGSTIRRAGKPARAHKPAAGQPAHKL
jgi:hypothetical protein